MRRDGRIRRALPPLTAGLTALLAALCFLGIRLISSPMLSQQAAERWQGESRQRFAQISCFVPADDRRDPDQLRNFRGEIEKKLRAEGDAEDGAGRLWLDAWSASGKVTATSEIGKAEARAVAVGGSFFQFHPLRLLNGSYIDEGDLMQDRVLLDEDLAWQLFGGTRLQGLEIRLNGVPFVVAGVVERERDSFSRRAYTAGPGLFLSFDAYRKLVEGAGADCYELVLAEPVRGFALNFMREKFPVRGGEILQNTDRFSIPRLWDLVARFSTRSMQTLGVAYPYWENAARGAEDSCAALMLLGFALSVWPGIWLFLTLRRLLVRGKDKLTDELLPAVADRAGEAVRVRQRRAWERREAKHWKKD